MFIFSTKNVSIGSYFVKFSPLPNYVVLSFTFCIPINILSQPLTKLLIFICRMLFTCRYIRVIIVMVACPVAC